jgi:hypothetical protein
MLEQPLRFRLDQPVVRIFQFSPLIDAAPEFVDDRSRIVLLRFCGKPFAFVENDLLLLGLYLVLSGLGDRSDELRAAAVRAC